MKDKAELGAELVEGSQAEKLSETQGRGTANHCCPVGSGASRMEIALGEDTRRALEAPSPLAALNLPKRQLRAPFPWVPSWSGCHTNSPWDRI